MRSSMPSRSIASLTRGSQSASTSRSRSGEHDYWWWGTHAPDEGLRLSIEPDSAAAARAELREMVRGVPIAEAAVEGFNDWQVIEATERLCTQPCSPAASVVGSSNLSAL